MRSLIPKYSLSINPSIADKPGDPAMRNSGTGWQPVEKSDVELAKWIRGGGAYAPQYRGGQRRAANFIRSGFLAADVDADLTLQEAQEHAFVQHHGSLIHTTASHTAEHHRFRIVFLLEEAIIDARDFADAQLGLALMFSADTAATDAARLFFGNTNAAMFPISKTLPHHAVADLIARGRDARATRAPGGRLLPVESVRRIAGPELVKVAGGGMVRMDEIGAGVRVHCPHHDDGDPSAYTVRSRKGLVGIYCSACKVTFWPTDDQDGYDFGAFDRLFDALCKGQQEIDTDAPGLERFFPPAPRFERYQERYLPSLIYEPGVMLVKSPKGSGKTEALCGMLKEILAGRFKQGIHPKDRPNSILLIGHRQTLLREAAAKLGLHCYLDQDDETGSQVRTLAVCLDSLPKYNERYVARLDGQRKIFNRASPFDLVIIDESEQVLGHLTGETINNRMGIDRCFDALMYEVANAKAMIALDADLGLVTTQALRTMRPQDWHSRCRIVYNAPIIPAQKRVMRLHASKKFLEGQVIEAIKRGERCFIVSNSKKFVDTAHRMIQNECGDDIVMRVITRDNSRDEATVRFLADIKTEILSVQVVLGSPSIGTGIDITFPNEECRVDRVFGFFYPYVNTHTDIDQQLARVRNPGQIDVWISPVTFNYTSNIDVIKDDLGRAHAVKRAVIGRREDGMVDYDRDNPLLNIVAHVTALQRASKNRLLELFCALREANGWTVEWVADTAPTSAYEPAKKMLEAERRAMLTDAPRLSDVDYMELDEKVSKGATLMVDERVLHEKNHFERTVGLPLDAGLIEMNMDGRLEGRVARFAEVVTNLSTDYKREFIYAVLKARAQPSGRLPQTKPEMLLAILVSVAGLTTADGFSADQLLSVDDLSGFVKLCQQNQTIVEETLGEPLRSDIARKPVRQLNLFLRGMGLKIERVKTQKVAGRKIRHYRLPADLLTTMITLSRSYLEIEARREDEKEQASLEDRQRRWAALIASENLVLPETDASENRAARGTGKDGLLSSNLLGDT